MTPLHPKIWDGIGLDTHEMGLMRGKQEFTFLQRTLYYADGGWGVEKVEKAFFSQRLHSSLEPQLPLPGGWGMNLERKD